MKLPLFLFSILMIMVLVSIIKGPLLRTYEDEKGALKDVENV